MYISLWAVWRSGEASGARILGFAFLLCHYSGDLGKAGNQFMINLLHLSSGDTKNNLVHTIMKIKGFYCI